MPITLYQAEFSPPCQAVLVVAKAVGVDLIKKDVDLMVKQDHRTPAFLKMNPCHTIPTLDDDGLHLWESRAIMAYLVDQYAKTDKLYPKDPKKRALVDNMLQFDLGTFYASFAEYFYPQLFFKKPESEEAKAKVVERLGIFDGMLGQRAYAAGDQLTIADIGLMCSLHTPIGAGYDLGPYENIKAWRDKVKQEFPIYEEETQKGLEMFTGLVQKLKG